MVVASQSPGAVPGDLGPHPRRHSRPAVISAASTLRAIMQLFDRPSHLIQRLTRRVASTIASTVACRSDQTRQRHRRVRTADGAGRSPFPSTSNTGTIDVPGNGRMNLCTTRPDPHHKRYDRVRHDRPAQQHLCTTRATGDGQPIAGLRLHSPYELVDPRSLRECRPCPQTSKSIKAVWMTLRGV